MTSRSTCFVILLGPCDAPGPCSLSHATAAQWHVYGAAATFYINKAEGNIVLTSYSACRLQARPRLPVCKSNAGLEVTCIGEYTAVAGKPRTRSRNLIATCCPVRLFRASCTKPKAPALRSFNFSYFSWPVRGSLPSRTPGSAMQQRPFPAAYLRQRIFVRALPGTAAVSHSTDKYQDAY